jgi:ribosomal protein S18 acetylase RimI-like enzyme
MIREAIESDCINLAALSLEVWLQTYCVDGIRTENSKYALSTFTEEHFRKLIIDPKYKLLVFIEGIYLRGYALINLESRFESEENGFEIEKLYVQGFFRGQGIGQNLLSEIINRYGNRFWLYTWVRNKSIEFYKKFGFKDIGQYETPGPSQNKRVLSCKVVKAISRINV